MASQSENKASKHIEVKLHEREEMQALAHALASSTRLAILDAISNRNMNVNELATALDVPVSTVALNVRVMEDAGLITTYHQPGVRGSMKICSRRFDSIRFGLVKPDAEGRLSTFSVEMPVGGYSLCSVQPTCGLAGANGAIGLDDDARTFYHPVRFAAELLWFRAGFVEYHFTSQLVQNAEPRTLEISFEACSEAPNYHNTWKSDITLWINDMEIGTWHCPGDFGGRRGLLNPDWWPDFCTQFGHLKTWQITDEGSALDGAQISDVRLADLHIEKREYIAVRIGVKESAVHAGGMNLFGKGFGDYPQGIVLSIAQKEAD